MALLRIWARVTEDGRAVDPGLRERIDGLYGRHLAWHRYLATARDPEGSGLLTIYHPWESGTDNSPRWDEPIARVTLGIVPPFTRRDLNHVADASHRPTDAQYDRYLWLIESLKAARYDDALVYGRHPLLVKDVLFSAIFALASQALGELAAALGAPGEDRQLLADWAARSGRGVQSRWDRAGRLALDLDVNTGQSVRVKSCAGLAPLLIGTLPRNLVDTLVDRLFGPGFAGAPGLIVAAVPSTTPGSPGFDPCSYWRGPIWPLANWLLWRALLRHGRRAEAAALRAANLALLDRPEARFAEYFEPYTGEPLGSLDQSWTAAVALEWLAS